MYSETWVCKRGCRSIYGVHDEAKDKEFELEMSWVCDESDKQFVRVRVLNIFAGIFMSPQPTCKNMRFQLW